MANTPYENFVLQDKMEDMFTTRVNMSPYYTVDNSLQSAPGLKVVINAYTATGNVQDVEMGSGNTESIEAGFTPHEYTVGTTQGRFPWYDEQEMQDPMIVDTGLEGLAAGLANDFVKKLYEAYAKTSLKVTYTTAPTFDTFVDALAELNIEGEEETGVFALCDPAMKAIIRKSLKADLVYSEDYTRTGYIGHVAGVPIIVTKGCPEGKIYMATREAATLFVKKGTETEQERDANLRKTTVYGRKVGVVALTDGTKCVEISAGA